MSEMSMGSNIELTVAAVRASLSWAAGPSTPAVDASALLLDASGKVAAESDFVFYNQPRHPSGAVAMAGRTDTSDPIDVDLARLPDVVTRVVLAASVDGATFGAVPDLRVTLTDSASGAAIATFPMSASVETAFVCAEFYRRNGAWRFRAIGQGYSSGLAGLAADFGIDTGGSDTGGSETGGSAPAAAAAPAPAVPPAPPAAPAAPAPVAAPVTPAAVRPAPVGGIDPLLDLDRPAGSLGI